jgi:hypothetical protein
MKPNQKLIRGAAGKMDSFEPACYEAALACCTPGQEKKLDLFLCIALAARLTHPYLGVACSWQIRNERIHLLCSSARRQIKNAASHGGSCILAVRNFLVTLTPFHPSDSADPEVCFLLSFRLASGAARSLDFLFVLYRSSLFLTILYQPRNLAS